MKHIIYSPSSFSKIATMALLFCTELSFAQFITVDGPFDDRIMDITQDSQGLVWVASKSSVASYDGYQFKSIDLINGQSGNTPNITDFAFISDHVLLIATQNAGVMVHNRNNPSKLETINSIPDKKIYSIVKQDNKTWLVSNNGLYKLENTETDFYPFSTPKKYINKMTLLNDQLWIASIDQLFYFDTTKNEFNEVNYPNKKQSYYIWDIYTDIHDDLILSTDSAVYKRDTKTTFWRALDDEIPSFTVNSIVTDEEGLWLGTTNKGLLNRPSEFPNEVKAFKKTNSNISSDEITKLFIDQNGNLWIGTFDGGLNIISKNSLVFGLKSNFYDSNSCKTATNNITFIHEDVDQSIWLIAGTEVLKLNRNNQTCKIIEFNTTKLENSDKPIPKIIFNDNKGDLWISYQHHGLAHITDRDLPIQKIKHPLIDPKKRIYDFVTQLDPLTFVFATGSGLISYHLDSNEIRTIKSINDAFDESIISTAFPVSDTDFILATNNGVALFDGKTIKSIEEIQNQLPTKRVSAAIKDSFDNVWIGTLDAGLFKFNSEHHLIKHFGHESPHYNFKNIFSILEGDKNNLWLSSGPNLIKINTVNNQFQIFDESDGLQNKRFNLSSALKSSTGKIYFGGLNGFNAFDPDQIKIDAAPPPVILTQLSRFNEPVQSMVDYDGFQINQPINFTEKLTFSHKDYVLAFEFAALNYINPTKNQYAYKLEGFDPNWNQVAANKRSATYTNLPSGEYQFRVKGSNKNGIWNDTGSSIKVIVKPTPWLSWWALLGYAIITALLIWLYINKKTKDAQKLAVLLKLEVNKKTEELKVQKQAVEMLLTKKNELFSNVSHEFRTPLTLILGPLKELIKSSHHAQGINTLQLIDRNANRLLSLVEQLLQLAKISDTSQIKKTPQNTFNQVASVVESFQHMAKTRRIQLDLEQNQNAEINVTDQCIDAILGNLVSNAIKYTQINGHIKVNAIIVKNTLNLSVSDNGAGLTEDQQKGIFKRFSRLQSHEDIEGIGIGLAVVDEVVRINDGQIQVISEVGVGSQFIVKLPLSKSVEAVTVNTSSPFLKQISTVINSPPTELKTSEHKINDHLYNILVIEDNHDMRNHIINIIKPHYNITSAKDGKSGVALAIEQVPDLIISDVMMPNMDGFKVSRIIRSDERTSHIPLVLLTALNDKINRIKGWREHIDAYMTKPFDADELLVQLESMLTIRDILKKKAGQQLFSSNNHSSILPKKDQQYLDKLMSIFERYFHDPALTRVIIAKEMATSERQLQRKLKALIDQNPADLLREFRLKKSCELLKNGYQVTQIADECGFSSVSYFSQCFKAQFGMPPKKYQQSINKK